jgi:hypothetical protein
MGVVSDKTIECYSNVQYLLSGQLSLQSPNPLHPYFLTLVGPRLKNWACDKA